MPSQTALPIRSFVSFLPGNGVGGAGVHWNGQTWRFLPTDFRVRSHLEERYGKDALPADMTIQDWPVSYDELEPYYDRFEKLCGTSGKAGNIHGVRSSRAAIRSKAGARRNIRRHRSSRATARRCSPKRRARPAIRRFRSRRRI